MVQFFTEGKTTYELAKEFDCTKSTIIRNLKINIGEDKYKELDNQSKKIIKVVDNQETIDLLDNKNYLDVIKEDVYAPIGKLEEKSLPFTEFAEIPPLNYEIENTIQKDLSSIPVAEVDFPKIVYMIIDKNVELEIKYLKDYPEWKFLSQEELNRKTIEVYDDLKLAKRCCSKEQKVIKVPNTYVFKIVAPLLLNRGISRIVKADKLIAL